MSKLTKQADMLAQLQKIIMNDQTKEASVIEKEAKKEKAKGGDTATSAISTPQEPVTPAEQNKVDAPHNTPQTTGTQEKATGEHVPAKKAEDALVEANKKIAELEAKLASVNKPVADDLKKLGNEVLAAIDTINKQAQSEGGDTATDAKSTKDAPVNQNEIGADKNPQTPATQEKATEEKSKAKVPASNVKSSEEADKIASYELGKLCAEALLKQAADQEVIMAKQAGRRDFENIVNYAAQALQQKQAKVQTKQASEAVNTKQAEAYYEQQGAQAFQALVKQAQAEQAAGQLIEYTKSLEAKIAQVEKDYATKLAEAQTQVMAKEAALKEREEAEKENEKFAAWSQATANTVMHMLRNEMMNQPKA